MDEKIEKFLVKYEEMIKAANEISEFKYEFGVKVVSDNSLISKREHLISGVNEIFARNGMHYSSSSKN